MGASSRLGIGPLHRFRLVIAMIIKAVFPHVASLHVLELRDEVGNGLAVLGFARDHRVEGGRHEETVEP